MAMDPLNDTRQFNDHRRLLGPLAILERTGHGHQRQECKKQHTGLPDKHPLSPTQQTKKKGNAMWWALFCANQINTARRAIGFVYFPLSLVS